METVRTRFEPFIDDAARKFIEDGIDFHNVAATGLSAWYPVNFVLRGERGDILGGLLANLWGDWLHVSHLWVSVAVRGAGHGRSLMREAEAYARGKGAIGITLETFSFQARPFYERLGFEVWSTIEGYPPGHTNFLLKKALR
jgi:ribosomal protein S18 acetylase RimI-like enzyme